MTDPVLIDVPSTFETDRLLIRAHRTGDGPLVHEALAESIAELRHFLWFLPWIAEDQTVNSAEIRCRKSEANFIARTDLAYLMFERNGGRLVGSVGMHRPDWQLRKVEIGYWMRSSAVGKGYASEGARTLVEWALESLRARRIEIVTIEDNLASRRVADHCGFRLEGIHRNVLRRPDGLLRNSCVYALVPGR